MNLEFTFKLVKSEITYDKISNLPLTYDIAFSIDTPEGLKLYTPTTVYAYQLDQNNIATAIEHCIRVNLPVQIGRMLGKYNPKVQPDDYFDTLERSLTDGNNNDGGHKESNSEHSKG